MMNFANTFRRDGYLVIRNVFTKEEIAEMKAEIDIAARMQRHEDYIKIAAGGAITIEPLKDRVSETSQTLLENNFTENNNLVKASGVAQILPKYDPSEDDNLVKASGVAQILPKYDPSEDDNLVKASGVAQILPKYDPSEDDNLVKASGVAQILPKYDPSEDDNLVKASGVAQILPKYDPSEDDNLVKASGVAQILPKYDPSENDKLLSDTIIHKPANYGAASPLHRDSPFWKGITPYTQISCWIPLQDVNEDNGCLGYIPGTHQDEEIENQPEKLMSEELSLSNEYKDKIKYIPIEAGDCLIHHGMILHGTGPNLTGKNRTAYVIHYMEGNSQSSGEDAFKNVKDCPYVLKDGVILEGLNV